MAEPILTLSALAPERNSIVIVQVGADGNPAEVPYELALLDDFGLRDIALLQKIQRNFNDLSPRLASAADSEIARLETDIDTFVQKVVRDLPDEVLQLLTFKQKTAIMGAFQQAAPQPTQTETDQAAKLNPIGGSSAQPSSASTEGTPNAGSTSP